MRDRVSIAGQLQSACSACGGKMAQIFTTRDYNHRVSDVVFDYARCEVCGLISLVNVPEELGKYYLPDYHQIPQNEAAIEDGVAHEQYKLEILRRFASGGRLLEIGPAWGAFALLAKRAGFSVETIDMDPACCEFINARLGIRAIHSADEAEAVGSAAAPDVVAAWHVLEHLRDPWRLLERLAQRLKPGGVMILALPNPRAFQFGVLRRYWAHIDAPRHLHLVPPEVLRKRAEATGLEQVSLTTTDPGSLDWNEFGWRYSFRLLTERKSVKRVLGLAGGIVAKIVAPLERREGFGSAYTAVFRKSAH